MDDNIVTAVRGLLTLHLEDVVKVREHVQNKESFDQYFVGVLRQWDEKLDPASADGLSERDLELTLPTIGQYTRQIVKSIPAAAAVMKPFQTDLKALTKLFAARTLPNEAALRGAINSLLEEFVADGPREAEHYVAHGEHVEMTADNWLPALEEFESAYVLTTKRGSLNIESGHPELLQRLHKEAVSILKKAYGKPLGTRSCKQFDHGDEQVHVDLTTQQRSADLMGPIYCLSLYGARDLMSRANLQF